MPQKYHQDALKMLSYKILHWNRFRISAEIPPWVAPRWFPLSFSHEYIKDFREYLSFFFIQIFLKRFFRNFLENLFFFRNLVMAHTRIFKDFLFKVFLQQMLLTFFPNFSPVFFCEDYIFCLRFGVASLLVQS